MHRGLTDPQDVFAAAHVGTSTGYATLAALATAGLITRRRGHVSPGTVTLDEIATAHHLHEVRAQRIQRHQRERATWHDWLSIREDAREQPRDNQTAVSTAVAEPIDPDRQDYLSAVLATGPPTVDEERHAIDLLAELVGARVLSGP